MGTIHHSNEDIPRKKLQPRGEGGDNETFQKLATKGLRGCGGARVLKIVGRRTFKRPPKKDLNGLSTRYEKGSERKLARAKRLATTEKREE